MLCDPCCPCPSGLLALGSCCHPLWHGGFPPPKHRAGSCHYFHQREFSLPVLQPLPPLETSSSNWPLHSPSSCRTGGGSHPPVFILVLQYLENRKISVVFETGESLRNFSKGEGVLKLLLGICAQAVLVSEERKSEAGERSCGWMSEHKSGCVGEPGTNPSAGGTEGWDLLGVAGVPTASVCL